MDDEFGDPNIVADVKESISVPTKASGVEPESQAGIPWDEYYDTDSGYGLDKEFKHYENGESSDEIGVGREDAASKLRSDRVSKEPIDQWAGTKFLLTPVSFVVNFATSLKNAVSTHFENSQRQFENVPTHEANSSDSMQKITTSLSEASKTSGGFTTQDQILEELGEDEEAGICSPMVNLFAEKELGFRNGDFLKGGAKNIYQEAKREEQHQLDLIKQGKDGVHAAFVDHDIHYEKKAVRASEVKTGEKIAELLNDYDKMLITYPCILDNGEVDAHQIYLQKKGNSHCSLFDVNTEGGLTENRCTIFYHNLAKEIAMVNNEEEVVVAGIKDGNQRKP